MKGNKRGCMILLALLLLCSMGTSAYATTIDEAQQKAKDLENQKTAAESEKTTLANQVNDLVQKMQETQDSLTKKEAEIDRAEQDLVEAKVDENQQYESMKKRIQYIYEEGGDAGMLSMVLQSENMAELLNRAEYANEMSSYDRDMLTEFQAIVQKVQDQEKALKAEYDELTQLQNNLSAQKTDVENLLAEKNVEISNLEEEIGQNATELNKLLAEAEAAKQAAAAAAAAQTASYSSDAGESVVSGSGIFANPCPGAYLSSGFGYRTFDNSFHKGYDFASGGQSLPTYAAADGTVIIAGWSNSAGNWVVIDHGNGLVTKYMHHSVLYVSAGQHVSKGQNIGMSGTTGNSSGVHLHFQVELNGTAVNPGNYL